MARERFIVLGNPHYAKAESDYLAGVKDERYPEVIFHMDELKEYVSEFLDDIHGRLWVTPIDGSFDGGPEETLHFCLDISQPEGTNQTESLDISIPWSRLKGCSIPDFGNYIFGIWNAYISLKGER